MVNDIFILYRNVNSKRIEMRHEQKISATTIYPLVLISAHFIILAYSIRVFCPNLFGWCALRISNEVSFLGEGESYYLLLFVFFFISILLIWFLSKKFQWFAQRMFHDRLLSNRMYNDSLTAIVITNVIAWHYYPDIGELVFGKLNLLNKLSISSSYLLKEFYFFFSLVLANAIAYFLSLMSLKRLHSKLSR